MFGNSFILIACFSLASSLMAEPVNRVSVIGKLTPSSSNYFSSMDGHFKVAYVNQDIPRESTVYLRHGFQKSEFRQGDLYPISSWNEQQILAMKSSDSFVWETSVVQQLYARGSSTQLTAIEFVFEIHLSDGQIIFDKGSDSNLGYFQAKTPNYSDPCNMESSSGCVLSPVEIIKN